MPGAVDAYAFETGISCGLADPLPYKGIQRLSKRKRSFALLQSNQIELCRGVKTSVEFVDWINLLFRGKEMRNCRHISLVAHRLKSYKGPSILLAQSVQNITAFSAMQSLTLHPGVRRLSKMAISSAAAGWGSDCVI